MPGLLGGIARTAVVAGTASAVSGRVARHQAEKFADRDQAIMANRAQGWTQGEGQGYPPQGYAQPGYPPPGYAPQGYAAPPQPYPQPAYAAPSPAGPSMADQLQQLAGLRDSGVLTEDEFAAAKAKLIGA
jgi:hypothetical protein